MSKCANKRRGPIYIKSILLAACIWLLTEQYISCRIAKPFPAQYTEDPVLFWKLAPGYAAGHNINESYTINSYNMREEDDNVEHPSLMMIGDSCTFGANVAPRQTIPAFLQKKLQQESGTKIRVYNAGCPGYSTQQSLLFFKRLAPVYKPNILIIANIYGDSGSDYMKDSERLPKEPLLTIKYLLWQSNIYRLLRSMMQKPIRKSSYHRAICRVEPTEYYANIKHMIDLAEKYGSKLTIILYLPRPKMTNDDFSVERYEKYAKLLEDKHTIVLNLLNNWKQKNKGTPDCFYDNMHPTGKGCELIAEDLAEVIMQREEFKELCREKTQDGK